MKKKERNGKIDFLKFIMSFAVITYHFGNAVKYENEWFQKGYMAVEFFFIVSGYLFAKSLEKYRNIDDGRIISSSLSFMGKKYVGLLPYHIFMCIATFIVFGIQKGWDAAMVLARIPDLLLIGMGGIHNMSEAGHEWYISAMLIVMFVLTPVMIKYREVFSKYIAPVLVLLVFGYITQNNNSLDLVYTWNGTVYLGILRALAEISLGVICYEVSQSGIIEKAKGLPLRIAEVMAYVLFIVYMWGGFCKDYDSSVEFTLVLVIAVGITLSFSDKTSIRLLNNKFVHFLGKLSLPIYLNHIYIRQLLIGQLLPQEDWQYGYLPHLGIYILLVLGASLLCMVTMDNVLKLIRNFRKKTHV